MALSATFIPARSEQWVRPGGPWDVPSLDALLGAIEVTGAAVTDGDRALTSAELEEAVSALAAALRAHGVDHGDAVAWQLPNCWQAVALCRACWRLGAVAVPLHHQAGAAELSRMVGVVQPALVLARPGSALAEWGRETGAGLRVESLDGAWFATRDRVTLPDSAARPADVAVALFTSGSTGEPRAVLHTHRSLAYKARLMVGVHGLGPEDAALVPSPIAHISGMLNAVLVPAAAGMRLVLMDKWDPARGLDLIERHRISFMVGPPTLYVGLMDEPGFAPDKVASMRVISTGAMGVSPAFVTRAAAAFGAHVKRSYGSTEAPTITTCTPQDPPEMASVTDGRAVGEAEVEVVDPATGERLPAGAVGEVRVRGPELFAGYALASQTRQAMVGDWFRTGDLGVVDEGGWLRIVGRIKDLIIRGGENIAAAEVEQVLELHPAVRQAVAVGFPDDRLGERVAAFVVADGPFDLAACRAWFAERGVAKFKTPERVTLLEELPLLGAGKPDRAALRARAAAGEV